MYFSTYSSQILFLFYQYATFLSHNLRVWIQSIGTQKDCRQPQDQQQFKQPVPFYNLYISSCGVSKSRSFPSSRFSIFKQYSYLLSIKFSAPCLFLSIIPMAVKIVKNSDKSCLIYRFLIIDLICYIHACR